VVEVTSVAATVVVPATVARVEGALVDELAHPPMARATTATSSAVIDRCRPRCGT
jgi:hypothetical protein